MFRQLLDDVRHAGRAVLGMPLLASVVILSLAVGIGVNAIVFSWVQALVWQPLPGVRAASDVVLIEPRTETGATARRLVAGVSRISASVSTA